MTGSEVLPILNKTPITGKLRQQIQRTLQI